MNKIAVIIPAYRVRGKILDVIRRVDSIAQWILVVDDACPEESGHFVRENCRDPRVLVLVQPKNSGVGGATMRGFLEAQGLGADILVKVDGDGQMDPALIPALVTPILQEKADFVKGNRFFSRHLVQGMPWIRLAGNAALSFLAKLTTGYWQLMDPTNGFFAMHASLLPFLDLERLEKRYFFENDLLFRIGLLRAVAKEIPMRARYADEQSSLSVSHSLFSFPGKLLTRFCKRIAYRYFIKDFNLGSCLLLGGALLNGFGFFFGAKHWIISVSSNQLASSGTVMLAALPVILGTQMWFFAFLFDVLSSPSESMHPYLSDLLRTGLKDELKGPPPSEIRA